jgi:hypothetical protein
MRIQIPILIIFIVLLSFSVSKGQQSPYAGQEKRDIKAVSPEEINGYLKGHGMGFAKAGELNHYPGPRHVLDLAEDMHLSEKQVTRIQLIYDAMHAEAVSLGHRIIYKETILNGLFAVGEVNEGQMKAAVLEIAALQGELRAVHLKAHLLMKEVLSRAQIARYDELRGYNGNSAKRIHEHQHGQ